jgi:hypothetical protein
MMFRNIIFVLMHHRHRLLDLIINCIWNMEVLHDQLKEYIIVPIHKKSDRTECSNY